MADTDLTNPDEHAIWPRYLEILRLRSQPWADSQVNGRPQAKQKLPKAYTAEELETTLRDLTLKDHAVALAQAGFCGDMEMGNRLIEIHGPIHTDLSLRGSRTFLNDEPLHYVWAGNYLRNAKSTAEIAKVMEWLPEVGLGWMVGAESEHSVMFQSEGLESVLKYVRAIQFDGELPHLVSGRVEHPELLFALHERQNRSHFGKAFNTILCWVSESTASHFPDNLIPYKVEQSLHFNDTLKHTRADQSVDIQISEVSKPFLDDTVNQWERSKNWDLPGVGLVFNDLRLRTTTLSGLDVDGEMLLSHQANQSIKHGFWDRSGRVLCQTTVDFLSRFETGPQEPTNLKASQVFVSNYAPIDLIARSYGREDEENVLIYMSEVGFRYADEPSPTAFRALIAKLNGPEPLKSHARSILSKDLMIYLTNLHGDKRVSSRSLSTLYREYGIDNEGIGMVMYAQNVDEIYRAGFKFFANTVTEFSSDISRSFGRIEPNNVTFSGFGMEDMEHDELQEMHENAIRMGLWVSTAKKPDTVAEAIIALGRRKFTSKPVYGKGVEINAPVLALRGFLRIAGVDACAEAAKTATQWKTLSTVFDTDELKPYLENAPLAAKVKMFTSDLGM